MEEDMQAFRRYELRHAAFGIAVFGTLLWAGDAAAQVAIGGAKLIEKDVSGQIAAGTAPIHVGDQVFQNEKVSTQAESLAELALRDDTNVSLGPLSQIVLNKFVYSGDGSTAKQVVLNASKGAFRFFSGNSDHSAYQVTTPQAEIGVRGTIYDVRLEPKGTRIVLQDGALQACLRSNRRVCKDLTDPGTSLFVGPRSIDGPFTPAEKTWDFAEVCGQDAAPCTHTTIADLDLSPTKTRTQLAGLPKSGSNKGRTPTKVVKRPVKSRQAGTPTNQDTGTNVPTVVTPQPAPFIPLGFGFGGGFGGGGFGGRGGGDRGGGGFGGGRGGDR
jgi:hypothetical protein